MNKKKFSSLLGAEQVLPVVVINDEAQAIGLAQALYAGGINSIEITLRSSYGVQAIQVIKQQFPDMFVVAGTVNNIQDLGRVIDAGVDAVVTPGLSEKLLSEAVKREAVLLPGVATASEIIQAMEFGFYECKMFPASVVGGVPAVKAFSGPFQDVSFCPTGGVGVDNYQEYLALENVMCVGGSWLAPAKLIEAHDWQAITALCKQAK